MIASPLGGFRDAFASLILIAIEVGCWSLAPGLALADTAPWFNSIRPSKPLIRATSANDPVLRNHIIALSPTVDPEEAAQVAHCAYMTGRQLAQEWHVVWMAGVQNFLVNVGARKGGLCFQWAGELLIRLNALKLKTIDLHWAESYVGTSGEHNVIVVTARGQPFEKGIFLDNWRYEGHLVYGRVTTDPEYRWAENPGELARRLKSQAISKPKRGLAKGKPARSPPR